MNPSFNADGYPVLIGSLPVTDHSEASRLVMEFTPEIPLWVQLPVYPEEGMIRQFLPGMPALFLDEKRSYIDTGSDEFDSELLRFYEEYIAVAEDGSELDTSRFVLTPDHAKGFFTFLEKIETLSAPPRALKGQVTGPFTFTTALTDQNRRAIFYDERLKDVAVKNLAQKARWQVRQLARSGRPVILFLDEPALAGFGSSEFTTISRGQVIPILEEVISAVHQEGGLAGIHVCANTDWSLVLDSSVDIVNFDAYSYFDRFILYPEWVKKFIESGGILAWGIVPTGNAEDIEKETVDSLAEKWNEQAEQVQNLGIPEERLLAQSLITPSCGTGSLSVAAAKRVLELTKSLSLKIRQTAN